MTASVHIHAPRLTARNSQTCVCLDCGEETEHFGVFTPWYGWSVTCTGCGRRWEDGEWMRLPFCRGAREMSIRWAREAWAEVGRRLIRTTENGDGSD
jgi:hypothetical protein